jgi:hypothetical protein
MNFLNRNLLINKGYDHYDTCGCGGTKTLKYVLAGTGKEIHVKPNLKGGVFQKLKDSSMIGQYSLDQLQHHI